MLKFLFRVALAGGQAAGLILALAVLAATAKVQASDVAFFYALDADFKALGAQANVAGQPVKLGTRTIYRLECHGHRVYAVKMGSGAVETAISATALLTRFHCDRAFSLGPVGALVDTLNPGEWYAVKSVVDYQRGSWDATGFQMTPLGKQKGDEQALPPPPALKLPPLFAAAKPIVVASGELFVASSSYRSQLKEASGADAVDMNLFGLESLCNEASIPLSSWRVVSDRADDQAGESFRAFVNHYDGSGGKALAEVICALPDDPKSPNAYPELRRLLNPSVTDEQQHSSSATDASKPRH